MLLQGLTPELSRTVLRPRRRDNVPCGAVAVKRSRLERIVRQLTSELLAWLMVGPTWTDHATCEHPNGCCELLAQRSTAGGVQPLSGCTEKAADVLHEWRGRLVANLHVDKIYVWRCLTPELSRTAARNGGVVHVTMQPSREAVSA